MFEITADHIARLNDEHLRTLVGLLCEAQLRDRLLSTSAVTWGGNQTAADGGVDVRVALAATTPIEGYIPRPNTVFQVKAQDMPRNAIISEMRPNGISRPLFAHLAEVGGAYIIVSSLGSLSDTALKDRLAAMREGVSDVPNAEALQLDFYDRTRVASWVRASPGLVIWVRERTGSAFGGWKPYSAWAKDPQGVDGEYLFDSNLKVVRPGREAIPAEQGLEIIRSALRGAGVVIRLVGLSGVGKTRLVQALFDSRIGGNALDPQSAVYCDISDGPDPSPGQVITELVASRSRAVVIVDNCPPTLHRSLVNLCQQQGTAVNLITIEYDIQEDQPEGTDVYELRPSSEELIERLIRRRYAALAQPVAAQIAAMSGGNSRVALALASTVERGETAIRLSDSELFERLFWQRRTIDNNLLRTAEVCSLVYSFDAEEIDEYSELSSLAVISGLTIDELHFNIAELRRRELMQARGRWRAVLPPAIANRLASRGLENLPFARVRETYLRFPARLQTSFCRRIGLLSQHSIAARLASELVGQGGELSDASQLNATGFTRLQYVAPACPDATLAAIQRSMPTPFGPQHSKLFTILRLLAYDAERFNLCAQLMVRAIVGVPGETARTDMLRDFSSLFTVAWSGTHASLEQRTTVILDLLGRTSEREFEIGIASLKGALQGSHFSPMYLREFGASRRDYGAHPRSRDVVTAWFSRVIAEVTVKALESGERAKDIRSAIANSFRDLWTHGHAFDAVERICRAVRAQFFWPEGWINMKFIQHYDSAALEGDVLHRLNELEVLLRPANVVETVRAVVLNAYHRGGIDLLDVEDGDPARRYAQLEQKACEYGEALARDTGVLTSLLPELLSVDGRTWSFGQGIARGCELPLEMWDTLSFGLAGLPLEQQKPILLSGFLHELAITDREKVDAILESCLNDRTLCDWLPTLEASAGLGDDGARRLISGLRSGVVPVSRFNALVGVDTTSTMSPELFADLVHTVKISGGLHIAIDIVWMRLHHERNLPGGLSSATVAIGRDLVNNVVLERRNQHQDHSLGEIVAQCLAGPEGAEIVRRKCVELRDSITSMRTHFIYNDDYIVALFKANPAVALDTFLNDEIDNSNLGLLAHELRESHVNPIATISDNLLLDWAGRNPERRFPVLASVVSISPSLDGDGPPSWSDISLKLLERSPSPAKVLVEYAERLRPMSWSGPRSAAIAANAALLDELPFQGDQSFQEVLNQVKAQLSAHIEHELRNEDAEQRAEERFE